MCKKIRDIRSEVQMKFEGRKEKFIASVECRAIRREFPFFKRSQSIKKFMAMEEYSKQIVVKMAWDTTWRTQVGGQGEST